MKRFADLPERLRAKIQLTHTFDGCWLWIGRLSEQGYARVRDGRHVRPAHRVIFELTFGKFIDGLDLHHRPTCPKRCVNPHHLTAMTRQEHRREHLRVTCKRGHPFTPDNTYIPPGDGKRRCRRCIEQRKEQQHGTSSD